MFKELSDYGHEKVLFCSDRETGLKAIIAVHSTARGPAMGGCRMRKYDSDAEALTDVLRLSRAMSLKNAAANLDAGGGKSVILVDAQTEKTPEMLIAFAKCVDALGGLYYTAEDVGMTVADLNLICRHTPYAMGGDESPYGLGDPSRPTAYGTYLAMKAAAGIKLGRDGLSGLRIAVQGVGNVGTCLVEMLDKDGAEVTVCDVNQARVDHVVAKYGVRSVAPDCIYDVNCDIFSPCGFGASINADTIPRLKCRQITGCANNQLLDEKADSDLLKARDIYFVPDFIASCGGVTMGTAELYKLDYDTAFKKIEIVTENVHTVDRIARDKGISTTEAAIVMATERIDAARASKKI